MIPDSRSVVRKAYAQKGYTCSGKRASYSKWIDTKHPRLLNGKKYGIADWCAIFVLFCITACAGKTKDAAYTACVPLKSSAAGVKYLYQYMMARGRNTSIPHYGDFVFLSNDKTKFAHVGLVYEVDDKYIKYIAGNETTLKNGKKKKGVRTHKILRTSKRIYAYGRPRYSDWKEIE